MFIIGESLQNLPNIVRKCRCYWAWLAVCVKEGLSSVGFILFSENSSSSFEMIRSFKLHWNDREGSLFWQWIASECCWMLNKRSMSCGVHGALFSICIWEGCLKSVFLWDMISTITPCLTPGVCSKILLLCVQRAATCKSVGGIRISTKYINCQWHFFFWIYILRNNKEY